MIQREKRYVEVDVRFSTEGRLRPLQIIFDKGQVYKIDRIKAIPHNSKCRYGERGAAAAKPKAQIILDVLSSILATQIPCRSCRSGA